MNAVVRLSLLCALALVLTGCGRHWLVGRWTLDRETTVANLSAGAAEATTPGEGFLKEVVAGVQKGVSRLLLTPFEGVEIEFTATEMRRTRNGSGSFMAYEIVERPASGTVVVKYADGEIATWSRTETGVRMRLPGGEERWVYFRAAEREVTSPSGSPDTPPHPGSRPSAE